MNPQSAIVAQADESVAELTEAIKADWSRRETSGREFSAATKRVGTRLLKLKDRLPHGSFQEHVALHFAFSARHARRYMRVAQANCLETDIAMSVLDSEVLSCVQDAESDFAQDFEETAPAPSQEGTKPRSNNEHESPSGQLGAGQSGAPSVSRAERVGQTAPTPFVVPEREPGDESETHERDAPDLVDAEGVKVPPHALPAFERAQEIATLCREHDALIRRVEELVKLPGGRLIRFDSYKQQIKDAKGNLWANRATHVCPYCLGKQGKKKCEACNDEGWTAKHVWAASPSGQK